jgi:hypothetical protein
MFINPFCSAPDILTPPPSQDYNRETIRIGGCLTNADEDALYSKEELDIRKKNRREVE